MNSDTKIKLLCGIIVVLIVFNLWSWNHFYNVKIEYRNLVSDVIQDAYERGAYPPGHLLYEQSQEIERLKSLRAERIESNQNSDQ